MSKILVSFLIIASSCQVEYAGFSVPDPVSGVLEYAKEHPFILAAVIVVMVNKESWKCVKEIISFFVEEHPILSIILIGFLLRGSLNDVVYFGKILGAVAKCGIRIFSVAIGRPRLRFG